MSEETPEQSQRSEMLRRTQELADQARKDLDEMTAGTTEKLELDLDEPGQPGHA